MSPDNTKSENSFRAHTKSEKDGVKAPSAYYIRPSQRTPLELLLVEMQDSYARYEELVREYESIRPNLHGYQSLVSSITGNKMGVGIHPLLVQKLSEVEGYADEDIAGNRKKIRVNWNGQFAPRESVNDWDKECEIVSEMVSRRKAIRDYYTRRVAVLREWKENTVVEISGEAKHIIEALVKEAHDEGLTKQREVTRVWNDGEIDSQKGGDLYGYRSVFTMMSPMNVTGLIFPILSGKYSYAVVTDEDAVLIRKAIVMSMK